MCMSFKVHIACKQLMFLKVIGWHPYKSGVSALVLTKAQTTPRNGVIQTLVRKPKQPRIFTDPATLYSVYVHQQN